MVIAFRQKSVLTIIGPGGLLHAFFSTVAMRLENGKWGSRFPLIMNGLHRGSLPEEHAKAAMKEAVQIRDELKQLPPLQVVWDFEEPGKPPPFGTVVGSHVKSIAQYFVTDTGRNLVDEVIDNLESQIEFGGPLEIVPFDGKH